MNNYLVIENRPELTAMQILGGMNFTAIKEKAATAGSGLGDSGLSNDIIKKGLIAVAIVGLAALVYKSFNGDNEPESQQFTSLISDSTITKQWQAEEYHVVVNDSNIDLNTLHTSTKSTVVKIIPQVACAPRPSPPIALCQPEHKVSESAAVAENYNILHAPAVPPPYYSPETFNESPNTTCKLWQPATFGMAVTAAATQMKMDCNGCDFFYSPSEKFDGKGYKGIWLHINARKKTNFELKNYLKNIALVQSSVDKCISSHPIAIAIGGPTWNGKEWIYLNDKTKALKCTYHFEGEMDIYLIFENAKVGDKLVFEDFVFARVVE